MLKRIARAFVLASLVLALSATAVLGHECYNASRSDQGNAGADNAGVWETHSIAELFAIMHFFGIPGVSTPLSPSQQAWAVNAALAEGRPAEITLFFGPVTIGGNGRAFNDEELGKATDGKGIDHTFAWAVEIYNEALQQP